MNTHLTLGLALLFILLAALASLTLFYRQRTYRRAGSVRQLLELADRLESDLKTCRAGLQQAHAVMSLNPDLPTTGEQEARHAIDAGLRSLLQQRIWIRDKAPRATQQELDEAAITMSAARQRLQPLLTGLNQAQHALDNAVREHIRREP
ncbi:hypothetical protein DVJ77_12525 [Dyella tabacisoli]|uniref:Uncharacterized protein n=1 Tax=Dyella tabacisoli TaxID=2282381 RepID=A0A369UP32_9GAMM|nr:hypothetical protein DVJ77_12525 [Dyella tabacisoli]